MDNPAAVPSGTSDASQSIQSQRYQRAPQEPPVTSSTATSDGQPSKQSSANNSVGPSPFPSRDSSPIRPPARTSASKSTTPATRSRKNSQQELSPSRTPKPLPQGASRSLSAATTPTLLPAAQDPSVKSPIPQKASTGPDTQKDNPRWPVSPRLRSPPPQLNRPAIAPQRRNEQDPPSISLQRATPSPQPTDSHLQASESEAEESQTQSGIRTPARSSTLETVQEVSLPNSPNHTDIAMEKVKEKLASELATQGDSGLSGDTKTLRARPGLAAGESGSESGSAKADGRRTPAAAAPPPLMSRQSSAMSNKPGRPKGAGEGSTQIMTVETETVSSVPQVAVAPASATQGGNGTVKKKPSSETIRPKKDKKKNSRKQSAVNPGTASSKAEIFEAKVASAVDEADDSDSEETFVYDSNPPDGPRRFHSRTPSATSMMSQAERNQMRSIHSVMESSGQPAGVKKNMKFTNTFSSGPESLAAGDDDGKGTGRSNPGSARGTTRHHHYIGRWGRGQGNGHPSLFDSESPFPNTRSKLSSNQSRQSSGPPSPRSNSGRATNGKRAMHLSNSYDLDDTTGADDERTPLIGSASSRSARVMRNRRVPLSQRQLEAQSYRRRSSYLNRFAACLVITMTVILMITGAIGFMFATSQPLTDIQLVAIKNVLASEPELMFDLTVRAHNPNIVVVTVDNANLEIFAKSIHAGTDSEWWKHPHGPPDHEADDEKGDSDIHISDDPPTDPPDDAPNMRLGTITEFDSPLSFEGSFFHKGMSTSTGEMRLHLPGNSTAGGSERWGRILQDEFDLVIKGTVKYTLPLSQKVRSASISGRTTVKPNSANDPSIQPNSTTSVTNDT